MLEEIICTGTGSEAWVNSSKPQTTLNIFLDKPPCIQPHPLNKKVTYFICLTIVLFPDSPAPETDENKENYRTSDTQTHEE